MDTQTQTEDGILLECDDSQELFQILKESDGGVILDADLQFNQKRPFVRVYNQTIYQITVFEERKSGEPELRFETTELEEHEFHNLITNSEFQFRLLPKSETPFGEEVQNRLEEEYTPDL
jgi:hypothetical protein